MDLTSLTWGGEAGLSRPNAKSIVTVGELEYTAHPRMLAAHRQGGDGQFRKVMLALGHAISGDYVANGNDVEGGNGRGGDDCGGDGGESGGDNDGGDGGESGGDDGGGDGSESGGDNGGDSGDEGGVDGVKRQPQSSQSVPYAQMP